MALSVACSAVAAGVGCGVWFWIATRPVPLTAGLSGTTWRELSNEFDRRVKASFPLGSSEAAMEAALRKQGFSRRDRKPSIEREHVATRRESSLVCNVVAYVYWRADAGGRLTLIRGEYGERGCI